MVRKVINYCGNIIYEGDETMVLNDVGYAKYDKNGTLSFHYYLKDHLGDNRVVMNESGTIEQVNDYYPTGALMGSSTNGDVQRYKYNGKELDRLNGLNWYDYGARNYDAAIARWHGMDKLCEKYSPFTTYGYCKNNFVNAFDTDGMKIIPILYYRNDGKNIYGYMDKSKANFVKAMTAFGKTTYGKEFISSFLQVGKSQYGTKGNGKKEDVNLVLEQYDTSNNNDAIGNVFGNVDVEMRDGTFSFVLKIDCLGKSVPELLETIVHEFALHGYNLNQVVDTYKKQGFKAASKLFHSSSSQDEHRDVKKKNPRRGGKKYKSSKKEILNNHPEYQTVFDEREQNMAE